MVTALRSVLAALSALAVCAAIVSIAPAAAGASTGANPAGVSCTVTPGDPGINEQISFDFNGFDRPVFFRKVTTTGTVYLATLTPPDAGVSASINPLGYVMRYRLQGQVYDIPCTAGANPPMPEEPPTNPANATCEYFSNGNDELVMLVAGPDGKAMHLRQIGTTGSTYVATVSEPDAITVPDSSEYFVRYRQAGVVYEIDCVMQPF